MTDPSVLLALEAADKAFDEIGDCGACECGPVDADGCVIGDHDIERCFIGIADEAQATVRAARLALAAYRSQPPMLDGPTREACAQVAFSWDIDWSVGIAENLGKVGLAIRALTASAVQEAASSPREGMEQAESSGDSPLVPQSPVADMPTCDHCGKVGPCLSAFSMQSDGTWIHDCCKFGCPTCDTTPKAAPQGVPPATCTACGWAHLPAPCPSERRAPNDVRGGEKDEMPNDSTVTTVRPKVLPAPARSPQTSSRTARELAHDFAVQTDCPHVDRLRWPGPHSEACDKLTAALEARAAAPVESVRPARTAREVAHDAVKPWWNEPYPDGLVDPPPGLVAAVAAAIERDRRGRTGDEPGAVGKPVVDLLVSAHGAFEAIRSIVRGERPGVHGIATVAIQEIEAFFRELDPPVDPGEAQKEPR